MEAAPADFLRLLTWREVWITMEAAERAALPPFAGSTVRGALGHLLRAGLCEAGGCGHECRQPASCRYYSLFESNRTGAKPLILMAPPSPALEEIAFGGPVNLPHRSGCPRRGESVPTLRCEQGSVAEPGEPLRFGLRIAGPLSQTLPGIIDSLSRWGLSIAGARFRLAAAHDLDGRVLYDRRLAGVSAQMPALRTLSLERESCRRVRIVFLTPAVFKRAESPTFCPEEYAARFFDHSAARAVRMHQACSGIRAPWVDLTGLRASIAGYRLFRYELPRHSFRQEKWLDFDGVVGWLDLEGDLTEAMPWARAAEVLHFGQKAAFGLGKVRVFNLE